jgi:hypothetical protein
MCILTWKGAGFLVAVFWFVGIFTGDRLARTLFGAGVFQSGFAT